MDEQSKLPEGLRPRAYVAIIVASLIMERPYKLLAVAYLATLCLVKLGAIYG
jgi:hypothetical protein